VFPFIGGRKSERGKLEKKSAEHAAEKEYIYHR